MGYQANEDAAYNAESNGEWRRALGFWQECLAYVERYDSSNREKIQFIEMKIQDCRNRM
jgi:hypothetical protein